MNEQKEHCFTTEQKKCKSSKKRIYRIISPVEKVDTFRVVAVIVVVLVYYVIGRLCKPNYYHSVSYWNTLADK